MFQNILIIRFSSLGDLVLTSPVFREIKRVFPDSHVTFLTSTDFASLFEHNPHIDTLLRHPRKETLQELNSLIQSLQKKSFDLIYDIHGSLRSRWICWQLRRNQQGSKTVWKINKREWQRSLLIRWKFNLLKNPLSQRSLFLEPLQRYTSLSLNQQTELFPSKANQAKVSQLLQECGLQSENFLCIGPSASFENKCWPLDYYQNLIEQLLPLNYPIVIVGGANEKEPQQLEQFFGNTIHNVAGLLSPLESAVLLKQARLAICNDTSIGHLAEAMGTPALVLFGPTVREFGYAPFLEQSELIEHPLSCRPCTRNGKNPCKLPEKKLCLTSIRPEVVFERVHRLLSD